MALRLVLRNGAAAAAAGNSRGASLAGPFRLVSVYAQPAAEELVSRGLVDTASFSGHPSFFSDGYNFHPVSPTSAMAQFTPSFFSGHQGLEAPAAVSDKGYKLKEDENSLCLKMDMPGLDKDNVKVTLEENKLVIKGGGAVGSEGEQEAAPAAEESQKKYSLDLLLKPNVYKVDGIKAEMKNGVLKVTVPKVGEEERKEVHSITVE